MRPFDDIRSAELNSNQREEIRNNGSIAVSALAAISSLAATAAGAFILSKGEFVIGAAILGTGVPASLVSVNSLRKACMKNHSRVRLVDDFSHPSRGDVENELSLTIEPISRSQYSQVNLNSPNSSPKKSSTVAINSFNQEESRSL